MEGSGGMGFPFGGDPDDIMRSLREFAEKQAETVQEAQREQFATLTLNTAVELTSAALAQIQVQGGVDERAIAQVYCDVFAAIEREGLDSNASVKPTALGLDLSYELCRENLEAILHEAEKNANFVRIDMEDSATTSDTLRLYADLRDRGFENVGIVLQSYLRRTLDDIRSLADLKPNVRLCKGIYVEPHSIA